MNDFPNTIRPIVNRVNHFSEAQNVGVNIANILGHQLVEATLTWSPHTFSSIKKRPAKSRSWMIFLYLIFKNR